MLLYDKSIKQNTMLKDQRNRNLSWDAPFSNLQDPSGPFIYLQDHSATSNIQYTQTNFKNLHLPSAPISYLQGPPSTFSTLQLPSEPSSYLQNPPAPFWALLLRSASWLAGCPWRLLKGPEGSWRMLKDAEGSRRMLKLVEGFWR